MMANEQQVRQLHAAGHYRRMVQSRLCALTIMARKRPTMPPEVWAERMDLIRAQLYDAVVNEFWCEMHPVEAP